MQYEQSTRAVIEFYKTERLPLLEKEIRAATKVTKKTINVAHVSKLITEYNQGLDLVHGKDAAYVPHYALETSSDRPTLRQFVPAFLQPRNGTIESNRFQNGPARGLLKPSVTQVAAFEDQPTFDISFLTEQLDALSADVQPESYRDPETQFEIVVYDSEFLDESDLDDLEETYAAADYSVEANDEFEDEDLEEYFDEPEDEAFEGEVFDDSEVKIYFDASIAPGMLLIELYNPSNDQIDVLYVPHIPINFSLITSIISDYMAAGGAVSLVFSEADKKNNLIIPIDPTDPDSDRPINPLLN